MEDIAIKGKYLNCLNWYPVPSNKTKPFKNITSFYILNEKNERFNLNETATQIIKLCDGSHTLSEVSQIICKYYSDKNVRKDVISFCFDMINEGIIVLIGNPSKHKWPLWIEELPLLSATLEITQSCNMKCNHCYNISHSKSSEELLFSDACSIVNALNSMGVLSLNLSGGEPLLYPYLVELVRHASSCGLNVGIATNGLLLSRRLLLKLKAAGLKTLQISIDYIGKKHDLFRGVSGAFDQATKALSYAVREGLCILLSTTVINQTVEDLLVLHSLAANLGVNYHLLNRFIPVGRGKKIRSYYDQKAFKRIVKTILDKPLVPIISCDPDITSCIHCPAGYSSCAISVNGDVKPCVNFILSAGNCLKNSIKKIWCKSYLFKEIRENTINAMLTDQPTGCLSHQYCTQRQMCNI